MWKERRRQEGIEVEEGREGIEAMSKMEGR